MMLSAGGEESEEDPDWRPTLHQSAVAAAAAAAATGPAAKRGRRSGAGRGLASHSAVER
jgi:hypothetical protein